MPLSEELHINDSKERREARSIFKHSESKAIYWHKAENKAGEKDERKHEWKTEEYTQGAMSVLFYLRNFVLRPGKVLKFNLANRNKNIPMQIEVLKREELVTKQGKFKALKLRASVKNDGKLQQTGHSYFWVSDDDRKMILQFEFRLKIGTLYGKLDSIKL